MTSPLVPSIVQLPHREFEAAIDEMRPQLDGEEWSWVCAWRFWNHACSPMDDEKRSQIRYGHYLGWFERADPRLLMEENPYAAEG